MSESERGRGRFGSELKSSEREEKNIRKKGNIHCHLRYRYFVMVNQIVMTIVAVLN